MVELFQVFQLEQLCTFSIFYSLMIWPGRVDPIMILKDRTFSRKTLDPGKSWRWCNIESCYSSNRIFALLFCISAACVLSSCPFVSQSGSTPAIIVEKRGALFPLIKKLFSKKLFVPTTSDPFELANLTKSIGRAGWEGVIFGEKNRWEIDSTIFSGQMSGCAACSGGDWPFPKSVQSERGGPVV